ncbi:MAG TPA: EthD family reductase [Ktedonobacterales bacterium]|nr:EthD family reductase [Ktedonobacterales bacterium]
MSKTIAKVKDSMVKVSILYPNTSDARFDMSYYITKHMPVSIEKLSAGKGFRGVSVERGLGGETPGSAPAYVAMCHYLFDSAEDFLAAFNQHAEMLQGDIPNYTDIKPIIQFSAVEIMQ